MGKKKFINKKKYIFVKKKKLFKKSNLSCFMYTKKLFNLLYSSDKINTLDKKQIKNYYLKLLKKNSKGAVNIKNKYKIKKKIFLKENYNDKKSFNILNILKNIYTFLELYNIDKNFFFFLQTKYFELLITEYSRYKYINDINNIKESFFLLKYNMFVHTLYEFLQKINKVELLSVLITHVTSKLEKGSLYKWSDTRKKRGQNDIKFFRKNIHYKQWVLKINKEEINYIILVKQRIVDKELLFNKEPNDWIYFNSHTVLSSQEKNSKSNNIYKEGFVFVTEDFLKKSLRSYTNEETVKNVNIIQKIPYKINIQLLIESLVFFGVSKVLSHFIKDVGVDIIYYEKKFDYYEYVLQNKEIYYKKNKNFSYSYNREKWLKKKISSLDIESIKSMENKLKNIFYNLDIKINNDGNFSEKEIVTLYNNIFNSKKDKYLILDTQIVLVLEFLLKYSINRPYIYQKTGIDYRSRLQLSGESNYVQSKLIRFFMSLEWNDSYLKNENKLYTSYAIASQMNKNKLTIEECISYNYDSIIEKNLFSYKEPLNCFKIMKLREKTIISLDATSSVFQVIGCLTSNYKLMYYTNVIKSNSPKDIYTFLIEILSDKYKSNPFINFYKNRKIVKYTCMTYMYGSISKKIAPVLMNDLNLKNILLIDLIIICNNIISILKKEFKVITYLKNLMNYYLKLLPEEHFLEFLVFDKKIIYNPFKYTRKRINVGHVENENNNKQKKVEINLMIASDHFDKEKRRKGFFVNIIHAHDAYVCINLVSYLKQKYNINIKSIHDCFETHIVNYKLVLYEYNKRLSDLLYLDLFNIIPDLSDLELNIFDFYNDLLRFKINMFLNTTLLIDFINIIKERNIFNFLELKINKKKNKEYINKNTKLFIKYNSIFNEEHIYIFFNKIRFNIEEITIYKFINIMKEQKNELYPIFLNNIWENNESKKKEYITDYKHFKEDKKIEKKDFNNYLKEKKHKWIIKKRETLLKYKNELNNCKTFDIKDKEKVLNSNYSLKCE